MSETLTSLEALETEARALTERLLPHADRATLVTLTGELGAGKTTFTQALSRALGIAEQITSPTFVLEKIYALPAESAFTRLAHIDAYRLQGGRELSALGFDELMKDPGTLIVLEWPEMVADGLPPADVAITLQVNEDESRTLTYA